MYRIIIYETESGRVPYSEHYKELQKQSMSEKMKHKQFLDALERHGPEINNYHPTAMKHLKGDIYELRPKSNRVLFFFFSGNDIVLLNGFKKSNNKRTQQFIGQAQKYADDYKRRFRNEN